MTTNSHLRMKCFCFKSVPRPQQGTKLVHKPISVQIKLIGLCYFYDSVLREETPSVCDRFFFFPEDSRLTGEMKAEEKGCIILSWLRSCPHHLIFLFHFVTHWKQQVQYFIKKITENSFFKVTTAVSFLHQRVPGCSVVRLTWRSRGSDGRRRGRRSDRYTGTLLKISITRFCFFFTVFLCKILL